MNGMPTPLQRLAAHTRAKLGAHRPAAVTDCDPAAPQLIQRLSDALVEHLRADWGTESEQLAEFVISRWLITRRPLLECITAEIQHDQWRSRYGRPPPK